MRLGLITEDIDDANSGVATYARSLAMALAGVAPGLPMTLIHRRDHEFYRGKDHLKLAPWGPHSDSSTRGSWNRLVRKQLLMPIMLRRKDFDLVHDTNHNAPFLLPSTYARVVTLYDLIPLILPEGLSRRRLEHLTLIRLIAMRADHIVTLSECSKRDIIRLYGIRPEQITAISLAADERFRPATELEVEEARRACKLTGKYVLHVGAFEPRKNLVTLVEAFRLAAPQLPDSSLVTIGRLRPGDQQRLQALLPLNLQDRVKTLGFVEDQYLAGLYSGADALVYPSSYEGFGLPVLEAMRCGTPVITSSVSSLPEVAGDAALIVNPTDAGDIARALIEIAATHSVRANLRDAGLRRAALFSWEETARQTLAVYEEVSARKQTKRAG